ISNVQLNGGGKMVLLTNNSPFSVSMNYSIGASSCLVGDCRYQVQVGFDHLDNPERCIYDAEPRGLGAAGTTNFVLTAPIAEGVYYLGFDLSTNSTCSTSAWGSMSRPASD